VERFGESVVEEAALEWFGGLGYAIAYGPDIAVDGSLPGRASYADVVLVERLRTALVRINPNIPSEAIDEAIRRTSRRRRHTRFCRGPSSCARRCFVKGGVGGVMSASAS